MVLLCTFCATPDSRAILGDVKEPSVSRSFFNELIIERRSCFVILDGRPLLNLHLSRRSDEPMCLLNACIWKLGCNWRII